MRPDIPGPTRYLPLLERLDAWHHDAAARHPGIIPCQAGCDACCHGPFDISTADIEVVLSGLAGLDPEERATVATIAGSQMARVRELAPEWQPPFDIAALGEARFDAVSDALADLPCPLLDESGACRTYAHRPMICRLMGLGLVTESGAELENGCPIQESFPDYQALPPQPFPLEEWEAREESAKADAAERLFGDRARHDYETTIAAAIANWRPEGRPATFSR